MRHYFRNYWLNDSVILVHVIQKILIHRIKLITLNYIDDSWFILILDHALTSELVVLNITNNGTRILIWFLESQDKVAILRMSINRKNVVRPLILYHFTALPKLNLENKSDISLIIMIKCVANLELDNWKTCLTWIHFRSKIIPNQLTIDRSNSENFRIFWQHPW